MKILLAYIGYPVSAGKYLKSTLIRMGYEVIHAGPAAKGRLPWKLDRDYSDFADNPDIPLNYPIKSYPLDAVLKASGPVDLIIQMDANFQLVGKAPVPNVTWMIDNHVADYSAAVDADILFGAHSWGYQHEDKRFTWLPCAYSPLHHYQMDEPKKLDLIFIGVIYPHRAELLNRLAIVDPEGVGAAIGLLGQEYNMASNAARIGLCMSACGDVPMRVFENAAQGLLIFCDNQRDLPKLGLRDGTHYIGFGSTDEAVNRFKAMLNTPELVAQIARTGKEALKNETYESRVQTIFNHL